jgi:hypothetical protein
MAETFGHQWTSNFGTEPLPGWIDGLADMTVDDIKTGLGNLKTWQAEGGWPPNMLQFRELCRPHSAPAHTDYVPLPQPKSPWDVRQHAASAAFSELREGILKPEIAARDYRLSDEDRARLEKLDWERIQLAADGDFEGLSATPQPEPLETLEPESPTSCTCKLKQVSANNWERTGKPCAYCMAWDKKLRESGLGNGPRPTESGKGKRRYRRAA